MPGLLSLFLLAATAAATLRGAQAPAPVPPLTTRGIPIITVEGRQFRDLDRNGTLTPYEDWRLSPAQRAADLSARMTVEEKAGTMMHGTAPSPFGPGATGYQFDAAEKIILGAKVTSLITRLALPPAELAEQHNRLQEIAERGRLGIPLTISTDPRHHFQQTFGASVRPTGFSQWPETLGFAAIGDAALVRRFGDIARQEYRAVGIAQALSPQADLATDPRWPRTTGTFGEDPETVRRLVEAYVEGFQGGRNGPGPEGVATVVKHWVGYGAAPDGFDGHNHYGRIARPGPAFDQHVRAFEGAFAARVAGVMPTYTILEGVAIDGRPIEQVGGGFNRMLLIDLLRGRHRFDGIILSDWAITNDCGENCRSGATPHTFADIAMPWGVEGLTMAQRFVKGVEAGLDQFGGTERAQLLADAVQAGTLSEARLDQSVRRIMAQTFALGLFERPFVDPARAATIVGSPAFRKEADAAQRRAIVVLEAKGNILPVPAGTAVFSSGIDPAAVKAAGLLPVASLDAAKVAIVRVAAPRELLHPNHFFGRMQEEGRLDFRAGDKDADAIAAAASRVPTIVAVNLSRPAVLTTVRERAQALVGLFGASDAALLDVLTGRATAEGRLPFELPSSMSEVEAQHPGVPHDTRQPLFRIGHPR